MDWTDRAILLSTRPHGEGSLIAMLLTQHHGRHAGLLRAGRQRASFQPGTLVVAQWRARLAEHLGHLSVEAEHVPAALVIDDPDRLAALSSACALVEGGLPERDPMPGIFAATEILLDALAGPLWDAVYVQWELGLLASLGFGIDVDRAAVAAANDPLVYVSPKTGRAVGAKAGEPYKDRLLPLPGFLVGAGDPDPPAIAQALAMTGYFIERRMFAQAHLPVPAARERLADRCRRRAGLPDNGQLGVGSPNEDPATSGG